MVSLLPPACSADKYKKSQRSAAGADKWLDVRLYDTPQPCLANLKEAGYQVVVTHLNSNSISIQVGHGVRGASVGV